MKKLLVLSGKGGTGKTTTAAAFIDFLNAKAFADCDVDAPNLHLVSKVQGFKQKTSFYGGKMAVIDPDKCVSCGACYEKCRFSAKKKGKQGYMVDEYACEGCGVCAYVCAQNAVSLVKDLSGQLALYKGEKVFSTASLKMGRGNSGKLVTAVKNALNDVCGTAPVAVIDGSPGIGCPVIASMKGVDLVLIVTEPSVSGLSDLERIVKTARVFDTDMVLCVNKYDVNEKNTERIKKYAQDNDIPFVGCIPYDKQAAYANNGGKSLAFLETKASVALKSVFEHTMNYLNKKETGK